MTEKIELPELPEDFFWRVGDAETYTGPILRLERKPAVMLMQRVHKHDKPEFSTVARALEGSPGKWIVEREHSFFSTQFYAPNKSDIPDFAISSRYVDEAKAYYYCVGINPEGIKHLAESVLKFFNYSQEEARKRDEEKRKAQEQRDIFFGDYPPKTLGKA